MNISLRTPQKIYLKSLMTWIKSVGSQPEGARATIINSGKGTIYSSTYTGLKHVSKVFGFYQDIKPYLPETYIDKYRYKPHKRLYGYGRLSKGFLKKKRSAIFTSRKFNKELCHWNSKFRNNNSNNRTC